MQKKAAQRDRGRCKPDLTVLMMRLKPGEILAERGESYGFRGRND